MHVELVGGVEGGGGGRGGGQAKYKNKARQSKKNRPHFSPIVHDQHCHTAVKSEAVVMSLSFRAQAD